MAQTTDQPASFAAWRAWTPQERESFFDAIARHRRAAWQVNVVAYTCAAILAAVVALLMGPLLWACIILLLDLVNFFAATPDLLYGLHHDSPEQPGFEFPDTLWGWLVAGVAFGAPGLALMVLLWLALTRALAGSALFDSGDIGARPPDPSRLTEQRLANVVEEMAIASAVPPPRVLISTAAVADAAVFGRDDDHVTLVVTDTLLQRLSRAELQGVAAHLIASIADGDVAIGLRAATVQSLFGLLGRMSATIHDPGAWRVPLRLLGGALRPSRHTARELSRTLADPFEEDGGDTGGDTGSGAGSSLTWRDWAMMPLAGPLVMTGFLGGFVSTILLGPLLAWCWRRRKYMADATSVRLTRDPDALAGALNTMSTAAGGVHFAPWALHLSVAGRHQHSHSRARAMFPTIERRQEALVRLGASVRATPRFTREWRWYYLPLGVLVVLLGGLLVMLLALVAFLLSMVAVALSMIFTGLPTVWLHALLRWLAG